MDAKMLGECYNRTDPPKQVDVMQCAILHFAGRPGGPLYAVEQLIEGDYVKYNSNSGFVKGDDVLRNTPQVRRARGRGGGAAGAGAESGSVAVVGWSEPDPSMYRMCHWRA